MRANVAWTGAALIAAGLGVFTWKAVGLGLPVIPSDPEGLWRVELEVSTRGQRTRGSVTATLPSTGPGQLVSDEHMLSDRLLFTIRREDGQRVGVWSGVLDGVHNLIHGFRVKLAPGRVPLSEKDQQPPPRELLATYGGSTQDLPTDAPEVAELLASLQLPEPEDAIGRLRTLFAFVADEIALVEGESDDALLALLAREGSEQGKARLLCTLLRAAGIPARVVLGLSLHDDRDPRPRTWVEAFAGRRWVPMSPSEGFFAARPADWVRLHTGGGEPVRGTGVSAMSYRYRALRERLSSAELAALMKPPNPVLANLSLYRLPVATQSALRLLLLVPVGALLMAFMRNLVGVPTFGTFLPVLVALALRGTDLLPGLAMVSSVILVGVFSRVLLDRLHLLLVPRLCILLSTVVLTVALFAAMGRGLDSRNLFGGVLLPIVILAMLIERFSITSSEEGWREACTRLAWTALVAVCIYPVFQSELAASVFFGFPELILCVMGALVWVGGYTGYRLFELVRFRTLALPGGPPA
ncbi:MAG: UUP1 family membrane protein [Myxococcota bacterium]